MFKIKKGFLSLILVISILAGSVSTSFAGVQILNELNNNNPIPTFTSNDNKSDSEDNSLEEEIINDESQTFAASGNNDQDVQDILTTISGEYANQIWKDKFYDEWPFLDMAVYDKSRIKESDIDNYIKDVIKKADSLSKGTDIDKAVIILTSLGYDATKIPSSNGTTIDLIDKLASGSDDVDMVGINDFIFALNAYDSGKYEVDSSKTWSREKIIDEIISSQTSDNGWALGSKADPDMTAMAIVALAPYYLDTSYKDNAKVKESVDKALVWLSSVQQNDGGFLAFRSSNANSVSMVILALVSLGIDPDTDQRFIKSGKTTIDGLLKFKTSDNKLGYTDDSRPNPVAIEQGFRALVAYDKFKKDTSKPFHLFY